MEVVFHWGTRRNFVQWPSDASKKVRLENNDRSSIERERRKAFVCLTEDYDITVDICYILKDSSGQRNYTEILVSLSMESSFSKHDMRKITKFLILKSKRPPEIYKEVSGLFKSNTASGQTVRKWLRLFQEGKTLIKTIGGLKRREGPESANAVGRRSTDLQGADRQR